MTDYIEHDYNMYVTDCGNPKGFTKDMQLDCSFRRNFLKNDIERFRYISLARYPICVDYGIYYGRTHNIPATTIKNLCQLDLTQNLTFADDYLNKLQNLSQSQQ